MRLRQRFQKLGIMAGMTRERIVKSVGFPRSARTLDDGSQLLFWGDGLDIFGMKFSPAGYFVEMTQDLRIRKLINVKASRKVRNIP